MRCVAQYTKKHMEEIKAENAALRARMKLQKKQAEEDKEEEERERAAMHAKSSACAIM